MLIDLITRSEQLLILLCSKSTNKQILNQIPKINDAFSIFYQAFALVQTKYASIDEIPALPVNVKQIKEGVYKSNNKLISFTSVPKGSLKYLIPNCIDVYAFNEFSKVDSGLVMSTLVLCEDGEHYEPEAFIYLFREKFFTEKENEYIVPFLALPSTIPDDLINHWVYLAMRKLSLDFFSVINYKYLVIDPKEVRELIKLGLYN